MKPSTIKFLILSLIVLISACSTPKDCIKADLNSNEYFKPIIGLDSSAPVLYSADFEVMKYHFSGLIAFRKMPENKETRIVFLTETGIRMMEFNFINGKAMNTFCMEAMKKKSLVKFMGHFIQMILTEPVCKKSCTNEQNNKSDYFCKTSKGYYTCRINNGEKEYALFYFSRKNQAEAFYNQLQLLPDTINLTMSLHTTIQLKRVTNAFK